MKNILLSITLYVSGLVYSQGTEFVMSKETGLNPFVVMECEGKTKVELYKKTLDWVQVTYKNPEKVIVAKIENDYIRLEGYSDNIYNFPVKYEVSVYLKDGKYKFELTSFLIKDPSGGGYINTPITKETVAYFHKKDGTPKPMFQKALVEIPLYFNKLNTSLKEFIANNQTVSTKGDW